MEEEASPEVEEVESPEVEVEESREVEVESREEEEESWRFRMTGYCSSCLCSQIR